MDHTGNPSNSSKRHDFNVSIRKQAHQNALKNRRQEIMDSQTRAKKLQTPEIQALKQKVSLHLNYFKDL
jgi:hypothetical protein